MTSLRHLLLVSIFMPFLLVVMASFVRAEPPPSPKKEFRSIWVTTAWGLDWPKTTSRSGQQSSLIGILDQMKRQNMNAIVFQVSARGDAFYPSERLPWAYNLTGTPGNDPGWDPLAFLIEEARKRGLEVHAWFNAFAVAYDSHNDAPASADIPSVRFSNPEWMEQQGWMNPGIPEARDWQVANVMELVENYDIDAIHFDRIRYASGGYGRDNSLMAEHNPEGMATLADWRRWNVTEFIRLVHEGIQEVRPTVRMGVTPLGHYDAGSTDGWGAGYGFSSVFQDSRYWAERGYIDYVAPQIYWDIGTTTPPRFAYIVNDWVEKRRNDRFIYVGIGAYQPYVSSELDAQIDSTRSLGADGQLYFRNDNVANRNFSGRYDLPAIVPPMPWRSLSEPNPVRNLLADVTGSQVTLEWDEPTPGRGETDPLFRYLVYRAKASEAISDQLIIDNPAHIVALTGERIFVDEPETGETGEDYVYYVAALSRNNVEGEFVKTELSVVPTDAEHLVAEQFELLQNYPNPFNPATNITFKIPVTSHVTLEIFDVAGRRIATLLDESHSPGTHTVTWDASTLASGVYLYRLQAGDFRQTRSMMLMK